MKLLDLFSGIGGFSLALHQLGYETAAFCEIEEYPQKILAKRWPGVPIYPDVTKLTKEVLNNDGITTIDAICGGFPCQDISVAGKQAGVNDETRSGLFSEITRLAGELRPSKLYLENVTAIISGDSGRWHGRVLGDLAEIGYDCRWHCVPAAHVGAQHRRDRWWLVADSNDRQRQ